VKVFWKSTWQGPGGTPDSAERDESPAEPAAPGRIAGRAGGGIGANVFVKVFWKSTWQRPGGTPDSAERDESPAELAGQRGTSAAEQSPAGKKGGPTETSAARVAPAGQASP